MIAVEKLVKSYNANRVLHGVDHSQRPGEAVVLIGPSGCGKSTFLRCLNQLEIPDSGRITIGGVTIEGGAAPRTRAALEQQRRLRLQAGMVFQSFNLFPHLTVLRNITEAPMVVKGVSQTEAEEFARELLAKVGLADKSSSYPSELSGGQQQRVAIARALVTDPPLLLADEPTGNLDTRTSLEVLALLQRLNRERGITIVLVTHERDIAACASRVITMSDGRIVTDVVQPEPMDAAAELAKLTSGDEGGEAEASANPGEEHAAAATLGGPIPFSVYPVMALVLLAGTIAGLQYLVHGLNLLAGGHSLLWLSALAGECAAGWVGSRWLRRRLGRPTTSDQRVRVALWLTAGLSAAAVALVVGASYSSSILAREWFQRLLDEVAGVAQRGAPIVVVVSLASVGLLVLLRYLLLTLFNPRR
jgi:ABC-type polar amino acid transport system ATPase subunit